MPIFPSIPSSRGSSLIFLLQLGNRLYQPATQDRLKLLFRARSVQGFDSLLLFIERDVTARNGVGPMLWRNELHKHAAQRTTGLFPLLEAGGGILKDQRRLP